MNWYLTILLLYLAIVNIAGFCLMGIDKSRAKKKQWRIKEKTLFLTAILGGSLGCIASMYLFRHKTKHLSFVIGMPIIALFELVIVLYFLS